MHVNNSVINKTFNDDAGESLKEFGEDSKDTNWMFDRTELGCRCNTSWYTAGDQGDCANENNATLSKQFFGCGMQHACDGDEGKGEDYASWCFTEDGCGKTSAETDTGSSDTWDYCHPPLTTTQTTTTTTDRFQTQRGCTCLDQWGTDCVKLPEDMGGAPIFIDGVQGIQAQQVYRCGMLQPCDGDSNRLEKNPLVRQTFPTWCFVNKDCPNAIKSAPDADDGYDYCNPLDDFYGSSTVTTLTTSTATSTTVTTIPVDALAETFAFMGSMPYYYFFIFVGAFFVLIIIVICVCKRHCVTASPARYNPAGRNYAQTDETTFNAFENLNPAASANMNGSALGTAPPPTPRSAMPLPGGGGGGGGGGPSNSPSKVATMTPGSIAPGAASAFDTENTTYALVHEPMEILTVEEFMAPKTSGYEFLAPDIDDTTNFDDTFAHGDGPPSYELMFPGQHPAEVIEGLHDYEYGEQQLKEAANVHDTTAEGSGNVRAAGSSSNLYADISPGHGLEGNQVYAAHAYADSDDDDEEQAQGKAFPETAFGVPESTLPRHTSSDLTGERAEGDDVDRQVTDRLSTDLSTDLAAANPFGDSADAFGDSADMTDGGGDGIEAGDAYEVETPLPADPADEDAAPPIPQRPESTADFEGVIGNDGGMSL